MEDLEQIVNKSPSNSALGGGGGGRNVYFLAAASLLLSRLSRVRLLATPWTAAYQAPLSMGFSRQEYWSGLPLPSPSLAKYNFLFP